MDLKFVVEGAAMGGTSNPPHEDGVMHRLPKFASNCFRTEVHCVDALPDNHMDKIERDVLCRQPSGLV